MFKLVFSAAKPFSFSYDIPTDQQKTVLLRDSKGPSSQKHHRQVTPKRDNDRKT